MHAPNSMYQNVTHAPNQVQQSSMHATHPMAKDMMPAPNGGILNKYQQSNQHFQSNQPLVYYGHNQVKSFLFRQI